MSPMINAARVSLVILLTVGLTACVTRLGRDFDEAYAQQIKPGETTKTEILSRLGRPPLRRGTPEEEVWTYAYYYGGGLRHWIGVSDEEYQHGLGNQKRLVVEFKADVVKNAKYTQEIPTPSNLPPLPAGY